MSKKVSAEINCPSCHNKFKVELFRSIWIEEPRNRELIFSDEINSIICPSCNKKTRLEFPFLCTNVKKELAIWYEPYHDAEIDKDMTLYEAKMGKNSFYAQAPRIQDWKAFKQKIIEFENKDIKGSSVSISDGLVSNFSGFIKHIEKDGEKRNYPKFLLHLTTAKGRFLYSFLPFLLLLFVLYLDEGSNPFNQIQQDADSFVVIAIAWYIGSYIVFTFLNWVITKVAKHWSSRKDLRLWVFGSCIWVIGVLMYVVIIDPYDNRSWAHMNDDEYIHMFLVMVVPPVFFGATRHLYEKYIK